jgi:hypothetical protein
VLHAVFNGFIADCTSRNAVRGVGFFLICRVYMMPEVVGEEIAGHAGQHGSLGVRVVPWTNPRLPNAKLGRRGVLYPKKIATEAGAVNSSSSCSHFLVPAHCRRCPHRGLQTWIYTKAGGATTHCRAQPGR